MRVEIERRHLRNSFNSFQNGIFGVHFFGIPVAKSEGNYDITYIDSPISKSTERPSKDRFGGDSSFHDRSNHCEGEKPEKL